MGREYGMNEPIAIVGSGCRFPGPGTSPSKLWEFLKNPYDISDEIPSNRFNVDGFYHKDGHHHGTSNTRRSYFMEEDHRLFDAAFFQIHPREAETMDPQQRILLETVYEAMESAGFTIEGMQGSSTSVFVGGMSYDFRDSISIRDPASIPEYAATGTHASILAARISYFFDWHGPCMSIDTACSSSLVAVHQAVQTLRNGDATVAVAAGSNLILGPEQYIALSNLQMLSPTGYIRMWDTSANGYSRGEGFGAVMLKTLSQAQKDGDHIECLIRETGVGQDGRTTGITMPSPTAQAKLIWKTYERAGLDLRKPTDRPQYFEAHGTGTPAGDPIEAEATSRAFFRSEDTVSGDLTTVNHTPLFIGSVKTAIGHLEGAAGIAGLLKASLAVQHGIIPPNLNFETLNPKIQPFYGPLQIPTKAEAWPSLPSGVPRRASVNSFGFGGTNAHAILESYDQIPKECLRSDRLITPIVISAKSEQSLVSQTQALLKFIESHPKVNLEDLAWTLQKRRSLFPFRVALSGSSREQLLAALVERLQSLPTSPLGFRPQGNESRILGVFTGQGAQYAKMGKELIEESNLAQIILSSLEDSLAVLPDSPSWSLKEEILADHSKSRIGEAALSQPLCTAIQIVLVGHLRSAGVTFSAVVGHSSGEIAAAYAAGYLTASDAIRIAFYRGLHAKLAGGITGQKGGMIAVGMSFNEASEFCARPEFAGRIGVAASNSPSSSTVSGDMDMVDAAQEQLNEQKTFSRKLIVDTAYHSHHMQRCGAAYLESLQACGVKIIHDRDNSCRWISSVYKSGDPAEKGTLGCEYWVDNMTQPVFFSQALDRAVSSHGPFDIALEVGPHPALKGPATETLLSKSDESQITTLPSYYGTLDRKYGSIEALSRSLGFIWERKRSDAVDFEKYRKVWYARRYQKPSLLKGLPSYSWDHQQVLYRESRLSKNYLSQNIPSHELLGMREPNDTAHDMRWRNMLSTKEIPWIKDHRVQGQPVVPAMFYVVMALEAAKFLVNGQNIATISILNFKILKAIIIDEGSIIETLFSLKRDRDNTSWKSVAAEFSCSTASANASGLLDLSFEGHLEIELEEALLTDTCELLEPPQSFESIESSQFYECLQRIGWGYDGLFRKLESITRNGESSVTKCTRSRSSLIAHPATLDLGLQSLLAAFLSQDDGYAHQLLVPQHIRRIVFNPRSVGTEVRQGMITYQAFVTQRSPSGMIGDIDLFDEDGVLEFQFEDISWRPLSTPKPSDDRKMFSKTIWQSDVSNAAQISIPEYTEAEQALVAACGRAIWYYYRSLKTDISAEELAGAEAHYRRLFDYIDRILPQFSAGSFSNMKVDWENDTHEQILSLVESNPSSSDLQLIQAVGENLPIAIRERRTMLEFMMEGNKLNKYYNTGLGYQKAYLILERMVRQITHRYPRMNILEVGAGTGGATSHILNALSNKFLSYTFTDVSSGFFERAQERFSLQSQKMLFKVFDLEKNARSQGYQEHSYDLILGSLVVHATKDLDKTLSNIRSLLKPGGYLVLVEGSEDTLRSGFMMSGLPGWWLGGDDRKWGPMVGPTKWDSLLRRNGFSGIDAVAKDSNLPKSNLGFVFVSQAVNDAINCLRSPLEIQPPSTGHHISVLGTSKIKDLMANAYNLLKPLTHGLTLLESIEDLDPASLPNGSSLLCLNELVEPIFKDPTEKKFKGLQSLFSHVEKVLFVIRGEGMNRPYYDALLGLLRSLRLEIPHLNIQVLSIKGGSINATLICETFLRLLYLPSLSESKHLLWSFEPELQWEDGVLSIPRIVHDEPANNRLNCSHRLISTEVIPKLAQVEVVDLEDLTYALRLGNNPLNNIDDLVIVTHSALQPIKIGTLSVFVCLGQLSDSQQVVLFSTSISSRLARPKEGILKTTINVGHEVRTLGLIYYTLLAQVLLHQLPADSHLILHDADEGLAWAVRQEMLYRLGHDAVRLSSSQSNAKESGKIFIPRNASRRYLKNLFADLNLKFFVDFSDRKDLTANIEACFPLTTYLKPFSRHSQPTFAKLSISLAEFLTQGLSSSVLRNYYSNFQIPAEMIIGPDDLDRINADTNLFRILDWTKTQSLSLPVKSVTDSFQLFSPDKTYLLMGLTGSMGMSFAEWMVKQGARNIVLTSRNPRVDTSWATRFHRHGATVKVHALDICDRFAVLDFHKNKLSGLPPVGGVINGAMVLRDSSFQEMSYEQVLDCLAPKVDGSQILDELFYDTPLEFFIMLSSIAWVVGNPGQSNYAAANGFMAGLAAARRKRGLAASTMSIGVITGVGYLARTSGGREREHAKRRNVMTISETELQTVFAEAIIAGRPESGHDSEVIAGLDGNIDTTIIAKESLAGWLFDPRVSHLINDKADEASQRNTIVKTEEVPLKLQLTQSGSISHSLRILISVFSVKLERMLLLALNSVVAVSPLIELGVDSLLAVEIRSWFKAQLGVDVPILEILSGATVTELAEEVFSHFEETTGDKRANPIEYTSIEKETKISEEADDSTSSDGAIDTPATEEETVKLIRREKMTFAQARMWRVNEHTAAANVNNLTVAYNIQGNLDVELFVSAFRATTQAYEVLRTRFFEDESNGDLIQEILSASYAHLITKEVDSYAELENEWDTINNYAYNLPAGETTSFSLSLMPQGRYVVIAGFHHIVIDTRSIEIFLEDLDRAYRHLEIRASAHLADHGHLQYQALSKGTWSESINFWKLQHLHRPSLIPLFPFALVAEREPMPKYLLHNIRHDLPSKTTTAIKTLCTALKVSPYHFHTAIFQSLLYHLVSIQDLCMGSVDSGRTSETDQKIFGPLFNYLPLRLVLSPDSSFTDLVRTTRNTCYTAAGHAHVPFDIILESLHIPLMPKTHHPLYQVQINYLRHAIERVPLGELEMKEWNASGVDVSYDFCVSVLETGDCARIMFAAQEYLYSVESLEWLKGAYLRLLEVFLADPGRQIREASIGEVPRTK
ncbi:hypothetical protein B0O99DRAFT_682435 [Bisporella sp. PMI_857]|nr:hypothetical protein B0O99DRAFT_682435 [Bisporella sp. PMI_857]